MVVQKHFEGSCLSGLLEKQHILPTRAFSRTKLLHDSRSKAPSRSLHTPGVLLTCLWHDSGMLLACNWHAPGMLLACFWRAPGMLLACFWRAPGMLLVCFWHASGVLLTCVWDLLKKQCISMEFKRNSLQRAPKSENWTSLWPRFGIEIRPCWIP